MSLLGLESVLTVGIWSKLINGLNQNQVVTSPLPQICGVRDGD